jgi:hypothetical protein
MSAFVEESIDEAVRWIEKKRAVLILDRGWAAELKPALRPTYCWAARVCVKAGCGKSARPV